MTTPPVSLPIPLDVDDLTPEWFTTALGARVDNVEIFEQHSGTTGRVRCGLRGAGETPESVFVKLAPFDEAQRVFVNEIGMGVSEARFYRELASEVPVRVPRVHHADYDDGQDLDGNYVMVLEDLVATGCRFPKAEDDDIEFRALDIVEQLAPLHARYWESERFATGGDLEWLASKGMGTGGDGGARLVRRTLETYGDHLPDDFRPLAELYVEHSRAINELYRDGERTLVHGDSHLGNLFVDGTRTGFLDWAIVGFTPGLRDVAYVYCNSLPTDVRRRVQRTAIERYCTLLAAEDVVLDRDQAWDQYRMFSLTGWVAATCTLAMGSKWQPEQVGLASTVRATIATSDLDCVGLLRARLNI